MPVYVAAHISSLEFSINNGTTYVAVNLFDASQAEINTKPKKQPVQAGKSVTAKKTVEVKALLFDHDSTVKGVLATAESAFTEVKWKLTLKTGNTIVTNQAPVAIEENVKQSDGLQGFMVTSEYEVPVGTAATTNILA